MGILMLMRAVNVYAHTGCGFLLSRVSVLAVACFVELLFYVFLWAMLLVLKRFEVTSGRRQANIGLCQLPTFEREILLGAAISGFTSHSYGSCAPNRYTWNERSNL